MLTNDLVNTVFKGFAKFVSMITQREVKFAEVRNGEVIASLQPKIEKFFEDTSEALENPMMGVLGVLEPGKIYCVQVDIKTINWEWLECLTNDLATLDITLVMIDKNTMEFVKVPEGYEITKV